MIITYLYNFNSDLGVEKLEEDVIEKSAEYFGIERNPTKCRKFVS